MQRRGYRLAILLGIIACSASPMLAEPTTAPATPATRPATRPASLPAIDNLERALRGIDLTADQREQTGALLADMRRELANLSQLSRDDRIDTLRQVLSDSRRQLAAILTVRQQAALRDRMENQLEQPDSSSTPVAPPTTPPAPSAAPRAAAPASHPANSAGTVGTMAPDFALKRLPSGLVKRSQYARRVLVIEFGSYSAPSFRDRSAAMDQLARDYGNRADFLIIYTDEAYPSDRWPVDRNKTDGVSIPKQADEAARLADATLMKSALKPQRTIAMDSMDNATVQAYHAGVHSAFVIDRGGKIVARQQWCDPDGLRRHIDAAIATPVDKTPAGANSH